MPHLDPWSVTVSISFGTKQKSTKSGLAQSRKSVPKRRQENDNDTGIYFSEKQVYEAKGICPDSEEDWASELV
jgi:hypothetical protein